MRGAHFQRLDARREIGDALAKFCGEVIFHLRTLAIETLHGLGRIASIFKLSCPICSSVVAILVVSVGLVFRPRASESSHVDEDSGGLGWVEAEIQVEAEATNHICNLALVPVVTVLGRRGTWRPRRRVSESTRERDLEFTFSYQCSFP